MERNPTYQEPYSPKSLTTTFPATKPSLGPTVVPTVQAPEHAGSVYPAEAVYFRHIDSSSGTSTLAGTSGRARLAEAEDLEEGERVERRNVTVEEATQAEGNEEDKKDQGNRQSGSSERSQKYVFRYAEFYLMKNYSFRKKISRWPIILGALLAFAILCAIGIFIAWAVTSDGFRRLGGFTDICSTKECIELSSGLTRAIDPSVSICDNFYRFSCGQFHFENPSNPENVIDYKSKLREQMETKLSGEFVGSERIVDIIQTIHQNCQ